MVVMEHVNISMLATLLLWCCSRACKHIDSYQGVAKECVNILLVAMMLLCC